MIVKEDTIEILLVEDRYDEADIIRLLFGRSRGIESTIDHVTSVAAAIERLSEREYDITLLDLGLPDNVGIEAVGRIQEASPHTPIFVLTGDERRETGLAAIEAGAQDYLPKQHMVGRLLSQMTEHCIARQRRLHTAEKRSMVDELTGLGNRRGCDHLFQHSLRTRTANAGRFGVALFDIDNFKCVNDRWGHGCGDDVIKSVGESLTDAVGDDGVAFRYGGEEFVVLIWASDPSELGPIMQRLRLQCSTICVPDQSHWITVSGGATLVCRGESKRDVFERSDAALYEAKTNGRNACLFHDGQSIITIKPESVASKESRKSATRPPSVPVANMPMPLANIEHAATPKTVAR